MIPYTDTEKLLLLKELEEGIKVVIPTSVEHAKFMIMVAQAYINEDKERMISYLKKEHAK